MRFLTRRVAFATLAAVLGLGVGLAAIDRSDPDQPGPSAPAITVIEDAHASAPRPAPFPARGVVPVVFFAGLLVTAAFAVARISGRVTYDARLAPGRGPAPRAPTRTR